MRKLILLIPVLVVLLSCSSDDDNGPDNGDQNEKDMIDERIIGKWKVEYSKTIQPAIYIETQKELDSIQKTSKDEVFELGVNYPEYAMTIEYTGNLAETGVYPESGMFNFKETKIEIKTDNAIVVSIGGEDLEIIHYRIEDGYLKWQAKKYFPTGVNKYTLQNNELIMELIRAEGTRITYYTVSKYSRIIE